MCDGSSGSMPTVAAEFAVLVNQTFSSIMLGDLLVMGSLARAEETPFASDDGEMVVTETASASVRPLRADAQRNRERLLAAAMQAFAEEGEEVALESVAARAGVGIGTLYRHFPNRDALVVAAYQNEVDELCAAAADLLASVPADEALRAWADRFADYIATKRAMGNALRSAAASDSPLFEMRMATSSRPTMPRSP